ncbi:MAG: hypothetical protein PHF21_05085 [Bacilli bacterium]|nr:hypothetical protein [Bacilli bacterium]
MKNKNRIIIIGLISGILFLVTIGIIFIPNYEASHGLEDKLNEILLVLANTFHKDYYYKQLTNAYDDEELKIFLNHYSDIGIKVDLDNLKLYASLEEEYKEIEIINNCDAKKTYVIFYPKEPFKVSDYTTKVILDCE